MMMGSIALRGVTLIFFVLVSSSFLLPYANVSPPMIAATVPPLEPRRKYRNSGRPMPKSELATDITEVEEEAFSAGSQHDGSNGIHQRMLRVRTNDYGNYDPSPTFVKPPFKLIPN